MKRPYFFSFRYSRPVVWRAPCVLGVLKPDFYLVSSSYGTLSKGELEAARRVIRRSLKKKAKLRMLCSAYLPITRKPTEIRMGKGKGKIYTSVCPVRPGQFLFHLAAVSLISARRAFLVAAKKLSVNASFVYRTRNISKYFIAR